MLVINIFNKIQKIERYYYFKFAKIELSLNNCTRSIKKFCDLTNF